MSRSNENMMHGWCNMIPIEIVNCLHKKSTLECGTRCCRTLHAGTILKSPPALPLIPSHRSQQTPSTHDRCVSICNLFSLFASRLHFFTYIYRLKQDWKIYSRNIGHQKCSPTFETSQSISMPFIYSWYPNNTDWLKSVSFKSFCRSGVLNPMYSCLKNVCPYKFQIKVFELCASVIRKFQLFKHSSTSGYLCH